MHDVAYVCSALVRLSTLSQFFSPKAVTQELKCTLPALTVDRIVEARVARRMLGMNTFQSLGSNSVEICRNSRSSDHVSTDSSEEISLENEMREDDNGVKSRDSETCAIGGAFNDQLGHSVDLDLVEELHNSLDPERDVLERSACQTAAGRALWSHVIHDPLAEILAGKTFIKSLREKLIMDHANKSRELAGVMLAVRTLWFDSGLEKAVRRFSAQPQVVLLGAGMDTRVYRLNSLQGCAVFEVDFAKVLDLKDSILDVVAKAGRELPSLHAKHVERVAADVSHKDWFDRLEQSGYNPNLHTIWILEGLLYYLKDADARALLEVISRNCKSDSVLLADFMNESSTHLGKDLKIKFHFHSDWPEQLLPQLGFSNVQVSQIGDKDANFGLVQDELHIFNQTRKVPRHVISDEAGKPYHRLLLVESTIG